MDSLKHASGLAGQDIPFDSSKAELFEALGHPARVRILRILDGRPLSFSQLKKEVGIGSSGHLQFHLGKLTGLVETTSEGAYVLTDDGREAIRVLNLTSPEHERLAPRAKAGRFAQSGWTRPLLASLMIAVVVLGAVAVFQQSELAGLSTTVSLQSSELEHPSASVAIMNFTVTQTNATAIPEMYLVILNNGSAPASTGSLLVGVYGPTKIFESCYNGSQNLFPIYSHENAGVLSPLSCGELGDRVVLTAQVSFLTSHGSVTRVFNAQTTIGKNQFARPATVVVNHLGIQTYVVAWMAQYTWYLTVTNESPSSVVSVNGTLGSRGLVVAEASGCVIMPGKNLYPVSKTTPLTQNASCLENADITAGMGQFSLGQRLDVVVAVTFSNGTSSIRNNDGGSAASVCPRWIAQMARFPVHCVLLTLDNSG